MIRNRIFEIIEPSENNDLLSKIFDRTILILISVNIISIILESFANFNKLYSQQLYYIELISIIIFTTEYILRIITSDLLYHNTSKMKSVLTYIKSPMALIDILAIIPFFLPMLIPVDLRILRVLRLTRLFRVFKINRYTKSLKLIAKVLHRKKEELVITLFVTFLMLLLSSSIMFLLESEQQPESFPNIIASFWWAIATLTTVGYGDVYPITVMGKILSGIIALLGIGLVALPTGIMSSGFIEELEYKNDNIKRRKRTKKIQRGTRKLNKIMELRNAKYDNNKRDFRNKYNS